MMRFGRAASTSAFFSLATVSSGSQAMVEQS
jgi:hypothetical protein